MEDNTEKNDKPYNKIPKPEFKPVEVHVPKEHKKKIKTYEEPMKDNTEKPDKRFKKIDLPEFNPKPVEKMPEKVCDKCDKCDNCDKNAHLG